MSEIIQVPCSYEECTNDAVGMCVECRLQYCGQHLHYNGPSRATVSGVLLCPDDLAEVINRKAFQPIPAKHESIMKLRDAVIQYVEIRTDPNGYVGDSEHYIFEEAVKMVYGDDIWPKLNKLPEH